MFKTCDVRIALMTDDDDVHDVWHMIDDDAPVTNCHKWWTPHPLNVWSHFRWMMTDDELTDGIWWVKKMHSQGDSTFQSHELTSLGGAYSELLALCLKIKFVS